MTQCVALCAELHVVSVWSLEVKQRSLPGVNTLSLSIGIQRLFPCPSELLLHSTPRLPRSFFDLGKHFTLKTAASHGASLRDAPCWLLHPLLPTHWIHWSLTSLKYSSAACMLRAWPCPPLLQSACIYSVNIQPPLLPTRGHLVASTHHILFSRLGIRPFRPRHC